MKTWTPLIVTSRAEPWAGHHTARGPKCRLRLLFPSCLSQDFPLNTTFKLFKNRKHFSNLYGKKQQKPGSITYSSPRLSLSQGLYSSCVAHITSSSCERNTQTRFTADSPTAQSQDKTCTSSLGSDGHLFWITCSRWSLEEPQWGRQGTGGRAEKATHRTLGMPCGYASSKAGGQGWALEETGPSLRAAHLCTLP